VINEDGPHSLSGHAEKVRPALPLDVFLIDEPQVGLVHEGGGPKRVPGRLPAHVTLGLPAQLAIDGRQQLIQRRLLATAPGLEQRGDVSMGGDGGDMTRTDGAE
jgi:hypothetical protein